jgi:ribokinase
MSSASSFSEAAEVVVVGSCNVDLKVHTQRLPSTGETVAGTKYEEDFGGKGANQAVQCAMLGVSTLFCGRVGDDKFGEACISQLNSMGVQTHNVKRMPAINTGIACISVDTQGANTIVVVPGANDEVSGNDVLEIATQISSAKVLLCQNEIPYGTSLEAMKVARVSGTITVYNPAPAAPCSDIQELMKHADILCPNESELHLMTNLPVDNEEQISFAARTLFPMGAKLVVVTLGEKGAMIVTEEEQRMIPTEKMVPVDTVGAGDSFLGTLAANLARGDTLYAAVCKGLSLATMSVTRTGAQTSYFGCSELPEEVQPRPARLPAGMDMADTLEKVHLDVTGIAIVL